VIIILAYWDNGTPEIYFIPEGDLQAEEVAFRMAQLSGENAKMATWKVHSPTEPVDILFSGDLELREEE